MTQKAENDGKHSKEGRMGPNRLPKTKKPFTKPVVEKYGALQEVTKMNPPCPEGEFCFPFSP